MLDFNAIMSAYSSRFIFFMMGCFLAGCGGNSIELISEEQEKHYLRGKSLLREGRNREALSAFLKVIEKRKDAAESHLDVGNLYLTHLKDPITAIYHFNQFLALKPDSPQASLVRQRIETAKKEFVRTLPGRPFESEIERLDLMGLIEQLKVENLELKNQLASARQELEKIKASHREISQGSTPSDSASTPSSGRTRERSSPATSPSTYTVQPGDNLSRISIKVYGARGRWKEIYKANRDILSSPHALKVGQELKIP